MPPEDGENVRADTRSSLNVHRVKLQLGESGVYETTLGRKYRDDYTQLYEARPQDDYKAGAAALAENKIKLSLCMTGIQT